MLPEKLKIFTKEDCFKKNLQNINITRTMYTDKSDITYKTVVDTKDYVKITFLNGHPQIEISWSLNNGNIEEFVYFLDDDKYIFSTVDTKQNKVYTNATSIGMRNAVFHEMPENLLSELSDMLSGFKKLKDVKSYLYKKFNINKK